MEGAKSLGDRDEEPIKDTYHIAYIIHFMLGAGNLLPWNALITAVDYFSYRYPTKHINKVFSIAYMGSSLPVLVLLMSWGSWFKKPSFRYRMNLGLTLFILTLMTPAILDWSCKNGRNHGRVVDVSYNVIIAAVAICGLADGLIGGSLIGSAGELPKRYMQAIFAGTASSGVLVSILRIITKAALPQTPQGLQTSAHLYFLISTLIMLGCIVCCNLVDKLPVMQQYWNKRTVIPGSHISHFSDELPRSAITLPHNMNNVISRPKFWDVAKRIRWSAFGILMIYIVTLSIFPGYITENVESSYLRDWYPILLITMYNVADLLGKCLTGVYVPKTIGKASWACVARLLFYPLFIACLHGPSWLRTEIPVMLLTCLLGLTNGFLTSVLMILAPKSVPVAESEMAGIVMALFLGIGLAGGSVLGWFWII